MRRISVAVSWGPAVEKTGLARVDARSVNGESEIESIFIAYCHEVM